MGVRFPPGTHFAVSSVRLGGRSSTVELWVVVLEVAGSNPVDRPIKIMLSFLNIKVSTITGIIVLLIATSLMGAMIFNQWQQVMSVRFSTRELE